MGRRALDLSLYLVTDTALCGAFGVVETVRAAFAAGVTVVQLRDPECSDEEFVRLGRAVADVLAGSGVPLVVNDRVHLVEAIGADGAHVGQGDLDVTRVRELVGPSAYVGLSVQTIGQVDVAMQGDAAAVDYLGVGPVWAQSTKLDAAEPGGIEVLAAVAAASAWPCVAIGGIGPGRVAAVRRTGAAGVAVVSAICGRPDVSAATRALRREWDDAISPADAS